MQTELIKLEQYKERLKFLEENSFEAITVYDSNLICIDTNFQSTNLFQYTRDEIIGMNGLDFFEASSRQTAINSVEAKNNMPYEALMRRKDGSIFPGLIQGSTIVLKGKKIRVSTCRDISDYKKIEREAEKNRDELETIFNNSQVGIVMLKGDRTIQRGNLAVAKIFGFDSPEEIVGKSIREFHLKDSDFIKFGKFYDTVLHKNETIKIDYKFKKKDGSVIWASLSGSVVDKNTPPDFDKGVVWILDDITSRKETEEKLLNLTRVDYLTGISNRRYFMELGNREIGVQKRYKQTLSLLMLDIDNFKKVYDTYGHSCGDRSIQFVCDLCKKNIRENDILGRLGGEEFAIILLNADHEKAFSIAERIRTELEEASSSNSHSIPPLTISIGLKSIDGESLETALDKVDKLLYKAKMNGKNQTCSE
ncbi:sensor domain-containing diguanylate cyclase [Oceanispirochaeta crateris]|uniref:sensor domain-containing diguanylate cyclase n=1 Tax=Oceanispirochaeta crateris TaxID=2518645 RepID=UPI00143DD215|nr:sensor domain-containing diguanylate cyclase [Oceanispirochaeta crateris]